MACELYRIGFAGYVAGWSVAQVGDLLCACPDGGGVDDCRETPVPGLARWVALAAELTLGWGRFPDGAEAIYLYDAGDDLFGYAFNVTALRCSEWGYAPFGRRAA